MLKTSLERTVEVHDVVGELSVKGPTEASRQRSGENSGEFGLPEFATEASRRTASSTSSPSDQTTPLLIVFRAVGESSEVASSRS